MSFPSPMRLNPNAKEFVLSSSSSTQKLQTAEAKKIGHLMSDSQKFPSLGVAQEKIHAEVTDITHAQNSSARSIPFNASIPSSASSSRSSSTTVTTTSTTASPRVYPSQTTATANRYPSDSTKVTKPAITLNIFQPEDAYSSIYWIIHDQGRPFALKCVKKDMIPSIHFYGVINKQKVMDLKKQLNAVSNLCMYNCTFENGCDTLMADIIATSPFIKKLLIRKSDFLAPLKISPYIQELIIDAFHSNMTSLPDISEAKGLLSYEVSGQSQRHNENFNDKIDIPLGCPLENLNMQIIRSTPNLNNAIHLKRLEIKQCDFPLFSLAANTELEVVEFLGCNKIERLPNFGPLPKLKALGLFGLDNLKHPPQVPRQIKTLIIQNCPLLNIPPDLSHVTQFERLIQDHVAYYNRSSESFPHSITAQNKVNRVENTEIPYPPFSTTSSLTSNSMTSIWDDEEAEAIPIPHSITAQNKVNRVEHTEIPYPPSSTTSSLSYSMTSIWDDEEAEAIPTSQAIIAQNKVNRLENTEIPYPITSNLSYSMTSIWDDEVDEKAKAIPTPISYAQMASKNSSASSSSMSTRSTASSSDDDWLSSLYEPNEKSEPSSASSREASIDKIKANSKHPTSIPQASSSNGSNRGGRGANPSASNRGRGSSPGRGRGRGAKTHSTGRHQSQQAIQRGDASRGRGGKPSSSGSARGNRNTKE